MPLPYVSEEELDWHVSEGQWWYSWSVRVARALATALGLEDAAAVRTALHRLMREALAEIAESSDE